MEVTGVKFSDVGKVYYFDGKDFELERGTKVLVETIRGRELATVVYPKKEVEDFNEELKPILRIASDKDIKFDNLNKDRAIKEKPVVQDIIRKVGLDIKVSQIEYTIDGSKMIISFASEERVDFRDLIKELVNKYRCKIELRQIGIRDETKIIGGIGICGRACCCASHLTEFDKVTIKMAKNQGLALNPAKVSGLCGKLMCCLEYENDFYAEQLGKMPKVNSHVMTPDGEGVVMYNNILKGVVTVKIIKDENNFTINTYEIDKIKF